MTKPRPLAVALAVAALWALGEAPIAGKGLEIDLTVAPADSLAEQG